MRDSSPVGIRSAESSSRPGRKSCPTELPSDLSASSRQHEVNQTCLFYTHLPPKIIAATGTPTVWIIPFPSYFGSLLRSSMTSCSRLMASRWRRRTSAWSFCTSAGEMPSDFASSAIFATSLCCHGRVLRSLPSLKLRFDAHDAAARKIAHWLKSRPEIAKVLRELIALFQYKVKGWI